jgi:Protein of unknown function (DUF2806).
MEWLVTLAQSAIQSGSNMALIVSVYKGLKYVLAPFKPLYDAWVYEQKKDYAAKKEQDRLKDNKLELLKFAAELAKNEDGKYPESVSAHCRNLMKIAKFTTEFINDEEKPEEWNDDDEWVERYFQEAQFVTDETLQKLWARLMKEKLYKPSKVNKRVVYIIRDMNWDDLRFVSRTMKYFVEDSIPRELLMRIDTMSSDIIQLAELGLVLPLEVERKQTINNAKIGESMEIPLKGYNLKLKKIGDKETNTFCFRGFSLTQEGMVVYNLIQDRLTEEEANKYEEFFKKTYKEQYEVTLEKKSI